jgi:hypothetical protein
VAKYGHSTVYVVQRDEVVYECRLCTDLDYVPHPGLANEDQEDEDSLQAVDGVEQDNFPTCQDILFFYNCVNPNDGKNSGSNRLNMCLCKKILP